MIRVKLGKRSGRLPGWRAGRTREGSQRTARHPAGNRHGIRTTPEEEAEPPPLILLQIVIVFCFRDVVPTFTHFMLIHQFKESCQRRDLCHDSLRNCLQYKYFFAQCVSFPKAPFMPRKSGNESEKDEGQDKNQ